MDLSLLAMTLVINLYTRLQREIGLNSLKLFGLEDLGIKAIKVALNAPTTKPEIQDNSKI